ncbi:MAG: hypothetical protein JNK26_04765 [Candidatus Doudnabacteria bacterium]|nr:hypothetical protein [Candidatus Doudnabacteria bacterium]
MNILLAFTVFFAVLLIVSLILSIVIIFRNREEFPGEEVTSESDGLSSSGGFGYRSIHWGKTIEKRFKLTLRIQDIWAKVKTGDMRYVVMLSVWVSFLGLHLTLWPSLFLILIENGEVLGGVIVAAFWFVMLVQLLRGIFRRG